jgi:Ca2+-binding RTX toxin-like protein
MTSSYNIILGTDTANTLIGSTGADSFVALAGDDIVLGAGNNDIVDLGLGNDSLNFTVDSSLTTAYGRDGNDSLGITVSWNTSTLFGGAGNDTVFVTAGISSALYGDLGLDTITFNNNMVNSTIYGGNLSDATSLDGEDSIFVSGSMSASFINGNGGADTIVVNSSVLGGSNIQGGRNNDSISIEQFQIPLLMETLVTTPSSWQAPLGEQQFTVVLLMTPHLMALI